MFLFFSFLIFVKGNGQRILLLSSFFGYCSTPFLDRLFSFVVRDVYEVDVVHVEDLTLNQQFQADQMNVAINVTGNFLPESDAAVTTHLGHNTIDSRFLDGLHNSLSHCVR